MPENLKKLNFVWENWDLPSGLDEIFSLFEALFKQSYEMTFEYWPKRSCLASDILNIHAEAQKCSGGFVKKRQFGGGTV